MVFLEVKDFQQLTVIKYMAHALEVGVKIISCETVREKSGLASSSRNNLLSVSDIQKASIYYRYASICKKNSIKI